MKRVHEQMQCDPLTVVCRNCGSGTGIPCAWPLFVNPGDAPPLYHSEREADSEWAERE